MIVGARLDVIASAAKQSRASWSGSGLLRCACN